MMSIDYRVTDLNVVAHLRKALRPVQYRELFRECVRGALHDYSDKTDVAEKFRQHYAEHSHRSIVVVPGGDVALRYWFPIDHQPQIVGREPLVIEGRCLVSYLAGYEHRAREQYLHDHYGDGHTSARFARRMTAYQLESHVRHYFLQNWPALCRPPSNHNDYEHAAPDDFLITLPDKSQYKVDVKSESFTDGGQGQYKARSIRDDTIYVAGDWDGSAERAVVKGIVPGKWLRNVAGRDNGDFFSDGELMSFEILPVMLNMAKCGMSWREAYVDLARRDAVGD